MEEITVKFPGGKRVDAEYKGFVIQTDQPVYAGGDGAYPAPFDLFLASIATCAGIYVLAFCQNRDIPTDQASVLMRMHKSAKTKMIEKMDLEIRLPSEFPEKYKNAVIKSVDNCAVKAHIIDPPSFEIVTKIKGED
jgi:putative redox protein